MIKETAPGDNPGPIQNSSLNANQDEVQNTPPGYFVKVPVWLFGEVPLRSVGVYAALRSFTFGTESCSPTEAEVSERLGVSTRTVKRARADLIEANAIVVAVGKTHGGRYEYTFPARAGRWVKLPGALLGRVSPTEVGLYVALLSFDAGSGVYPKVETIAERAGISRTQTKDYIRTLRDAGVIEVIGRVTDNAKTTSNWYHFPDLQQFAGEPDQDCGATGLVTPVMTDPARLRCQIPPAFGDKSRPQTRTLNQNTDLEEAGWPAPMARHRLAGGTSEPLWPPGESPHDHLVAPGGPLGGSPSGPGDHLVNSVVPGDHLAACGEKADEIAKEERNPEINDSGALEHLLDTLVDLMAEKSVVLGRNAPNPAKRASWLKSARRILVTDQRDCSEAYTLLDRAMTDDYWSGRIKNLYTFAEHYDQIQAEFDKREPRGINQVRRERRRAQRIETAGTPKEHVGLGGSKLSDL